MSPDPAQATATASGGTVDLAQLDDKHLSQYRHPTEWWSMVAIAVGAVIALTVIWIARPYFGDTFHFLPGPIIRLIVEWTHPQRIGLVVLVALLITWATDVAAQTTREWQLVARAVEITPTTYPQLAPIVEDLRGRFDLPRTRVYISREAPAAGYTVGVREPYAIVLSAVTVGSLTRDELKFVLGREMGHIKLRHTWASTLLGSAQMHLPEPFSYLLKVRAVLFGSYQHAQELSCDRIGVVATRDVRPALSALIKQELGSVKGSQVDLNSLAPQAEALRRGLSGASLRLLQKMSAKPFAVSRLLELIEWAGLPEQTPAEVGPVAKPTETTVSPSMTPDPAAAPTISAAA